MLVRQLRQRLRRCESSWRRRRKAPRARFRRRFAEKAAAESQIAALGQEREAVRQRVEKMLQQMDELL